MDLTVELIPMVLVGDDSVMLRSKDVSDLLEQAGIECF